MEGKNKNENIIGPEDLKKMGKFFPVTIPDPVPLMPFAPDKDYIIVLGCSKTANGDNLTLNKMRSMFGINPEKSEPCFYNQDWYFNERFAREKTLRDKWYMIRKNYKKGSAGKDPKKVVLDENEALPSAVLTAFVFFAYWFTTGGIALWETEFLWCLDNDSNRDQIYTGRYRDPIRMNKNGFNIHRHLSIKPNYGIIPVRRSQKQ